MTRHLSEDALVDAAETGGAHPHVVRCDKCRRRVEQLREAIADVRQVEVPEPSPLFWDRLSERIRADVTASDAGGQMAADSVERRTVLRRFAYVTLALFLVAAALWQLDSTRREQSAAHGPAARPPAVADERRSADSADSATDDISWSLVTDTATAVDFDTATQAEGLSLQPGAAERAALQLSADEQRELVRLLQAAVEQPE